MESSCQPSTCHPRTILIKRSSRYYTHTQEWKLSPWWTTRWYTSKSLLLPASLTLIILFEDFIIRNPSLGFTSKEHFIILPIRESCSTHLGLDLQQVIFLPVLPVLFNKASRRIMSHITFLNPSAPYHWSVLLTLLYSYYLLIWYQSIINSADDNNFILS